MRRHGNSRILAWIVLALVIAGAAAAETYRQARNKQTQRAIAMTGGAPDRAPSIMRRFGCAACHAIPDVPAPGGLAAPALANISQRLYLGGSVANTPEHLIRWIVDPKQFNARTAMPVTGISEAEARDVAAYLYTLQ